MLCPSMLGKYSKPLNMFKNGPIIVIEDDMDDQMVLEEIFKELAYPNKLLFFGDGERALEYLNKSDEKPFLILSDINLPKLDGFALRDKIHNNEALRLKCIPYLFFTTAASHTAIMEAYAKSIQGFFIKPDNFDALQRIIKKIIEYWKECQAPNLP
jgi:CheY-like chemotaxis protein